MKKLILTLTAAIMMLAGCASTSAFFQDQSISQTANNNIYQQVKIDGPSNIGVTTQNAYVLITGQIPSQELKNQVTDVVNSIDGVKKVYNFLEIGPPVSLATHTTDSWITTKIKSEFIANKQIIPSEIKVVTENGVVYLMGEVPQSMGAAAVKTARSTDNVREVVTAFEYVNLTETT